ncbi:MAG: class I SAM-dependent methyltransferase [Candidatus Omnitrophota bacterium]
MNDLLGRKLARMRADFVFPHIRGRLLDIGCGNNELVRRYQNGVGADVFDWGDIDLLISDPARLDFEPGSFDTITIIAAFNHIANRKEVLKECYRVLAADGRLIITMISPVVGLIWHKLRFPWDSDQKVRGMKAGEVYGLSGAQILGLARMGNFVLENRQRFMAGFNTMYIFKKN